MRRPRAWTVKIRINCKIICIASRSTIDPAARPFPRPPCLCHMSHRFSGRPRRASPGRRALYGCQMAIAGDCSFLTRSKAPCGPGRKLPSNRAVDCIGCSHSPAAAAKAMTPETAAQGGNPIACRCMRTHCVNGMAARIASQASTSQARMAWRGVRTA